MTSQKHCQLRVENYQRDWERLLFSIKRNTGWSWERIAEQMQVGHYVLDNLRANRSEPTHSLGEFLIEWERVSGGAAALLLEAPRAVEYHA